MPNKISQLDIGDGNIYDLVGGSDIPVYETMAEALAAIQSGEIPNEQPFIVKEGSQGQPIFVGTTAAINAADQAGQIPDGMIIYCTDDDAGANITASSIEYGSSTVKDELDNIKVCKLLGSALTPTTANTAITINLNESINNFALISIEYCYRWGASHFLMYHTKGISSIPFIQECGGIGYIRIDRLSATSIKVTTGSYDLGYPTGDKDYIRVYGIIRVS